jgi:hypothetical protein
MTIPIKSPYEESAALAMPSALQTCRGPWVLIVTILASSMALSMARPSMWLFPHFRRHFMQRCRTCNGWSRAYALLLASLLLVDRDRPELAGMQTSDLCIRRAIDQAFLSGYRDVIWISVGLAILSALSAQMIGPKERLIRVR